MTQLGRIVTELARAKVNLTLEVLGRRPDGYHELASLVAFADIGDRLALTESADWSVTCGGPQAGYIVGENLVERAARAVRERWAQSATGRIDLHKVLPVAAGIGGGSADAAAALRALIALNTNLPDSHGWLTIAQSLGADVPVCLTNRLSFLRGLGERVDCLTMAVRLPAVLVNPATPLATARVFAGLAAQPLPESWRTSSPPLFRNLPEIMSWVMAGRNDLEAPALRLAPIIGRVRAALQSCHGCHFARLSGSGPTCFGLFETAGQAENAAGVIAREQPGWWVRATTLG